MVKGGDAAARTDVEVEVYHAEFAAEGGFVEYVLRDDVYTAKSESLSLCGAKFGSSRELGFAGFDVLPADHLHVGIEQKIAASFAVGNCKCGNRLRVLVVLNEGSKVEIGEDVAIHQDKVFVVLKQVLGFEQATAGF